MTLELSRHRAVVAVMALLGCILVFSGCDADLASTTTENAETSPSGDQAAENMDADENQSAAPQGDSTAETEESEDPLGPSTNPANQENAAKPKDATKQEPDPVASAPESRQTTEGWWRMLFSTPSNADGVVHDVSAGFLKIGKTDDGYALEEIRLNNIVSPAELTQESSVSENDVRLFFQYQDLKFDYAGRLGEDGVIRGNLQFEGPRQNLVRLVPVTEESVPDEVADGEDIGPTAHAEEIRDALVSSDPAASLQNGVSKWKGSPALYFAYTDLLEQADELKLTKPVVESLVKGFLDEAELWGERAVHYGMIKAGISLLSSSDHSSLGKELIGRAREQAPDLVEYWDAEIAYMEKLAAIESAWKNVASGKQEGLTTLQQIYDSEGMPSQYLTYRLAQAERKLGSKERAERLFAKAAILPWSGRGLAQLQSREDFVPPGQIVAAMYEERTGGRDGLESYLDAVYHDEVTGFVPDEEQNRAATESKRVVLLELFTGATCPPCVAADVGTEAIERSFPHEDAVVLRYHLHIPGPDPMATPATEQRQEFYSSDILGTPTLLVNGTTPLFSVGGAYERSALVYGAISGLLSEKVAEPTVATLDLAATVEKENLHITATGSAGEKPFDTVKLRIVIAENQIDYAAPNGVRQHSMIVRGMPGGPEGISSDKGSFTFDETVSLIELREEIHSYLDSFENRVGRPFAVRPANFRHLTVVAFLQDEVTHEILQAAVVPIGEEITLPPAAEADAPKVEAPQPEEEAATGGPALGTPGDEE